MVSTNLNPGRKVLKVKPAEKYIITVLRSARREDILLPLTFLTHCLRNQRQQGEGLAEEQREVYTVSNHLTPSLTLSILLPLNAFPTKAPGAPCL